MNRTAQGEMVVIAMDGKALVSAYLCQVTLFLQHRDLVIKIYI